MQWPAGRWVCASSNVSFSCSEFCIMLFMVLEDFGGPLLYSMTKSSTATSAKPRKLWKIQTFLYLLFQKLFLYLSLKVKMTDKIAKFFLQQLNTDQKFLRFIFFSPQFLWVILKFRSSIKRVTFCLIYISVLQIFCWRCVIKAEQTISINSIKQTQIQDILLVFQQGDFAKSWCTKLFSIVDAAFDNWRGLYLLLPLSFCLKIRDEN